jgi:hypothetical protein
MRPPKPVSVHITRLWRVWRRAQQQKLLCAVFREPERSGQLGRTFEAYRKVCLHDGWHWSAINQILFAEYGRNF